PAENDARLMFFYRGLPLDPEDARKFADVLMLPPHTLHPAEIAEITPLLRGKENPDEFEILGLQTENMNGKCVLVLTGIYKEDQRPMMAVFIDADGSGAVVQEIEYQGSLEKYAQYLPQVQIALKSICWR